MRGRVCLVIFASCVIYLLGNARVPLWDRDEPRNAQAAKQMLESGDWVVPHFLDKIRTAKPPFTNWCQVLAMECFGANAFAARFPSAIAMTLTLILLAVLLGRFVDRRRAFWTVFILATSAIVIGWSARTSMTDAVLLLWVTAAQFCLYRIWRGRGTWPIIVIFGIAIGLGGLTKGPVVLGVLAMTALALLAIRGIDDYLHRRSGPAEGRQINVRHVIRGPSAHSLSEILLKGFVVVVLIAVVVGPWWYLVEQRAPGFIGESLSKNVVSRAFEPLEQHAGPPGYYFLVLWGIFMPWSVLLPMAFILGWKRRADPRIAFALAATIGPWLMFECVRTKLPHYLLPIFPALAFLTADAIVRGLDGEHPDLLSVGMRVAVAIWALAILAFGTAPWLAVGHFDHLPLAAMSAFSIFAVAYAGFVLFCFLKQRVRIALLSMGFGMMIAMVILFGWYLPSAPQFQLSKCIAADLQTHGGDAAHTRAGDVQMIGYKEPSLAFYQGGTIREQPEDHFLLTHPVSDWPKWTVIRADVWKGMPRRVKDEATVIGTCRGLDVADRARVWSVLVIEKKK